MTVLNELKPGLDEKLYENAFVIELRERGHSVNQQKAFEVQYRGRQIGKLIPDLIIDDLVIADPKVVSAFNETHLAQMTGYLALTGLRLALLLNFSASADPPWRKIRETEMETSGEMIIISVPSVLLSVRFLFF